MSSKLNQEPSPLPAETSEGQVSQTELPSGGPAGMPVLLHGPYRTPDIRVGDSVWCEFRQAEVVVKSISAGPIPWPAVPHSNVDSQIVCGDLARAIRMESSKAVQAWWNVPDHRVSKWRTALGVTLNSEGTRQQRRASRQLVYLARQKESWVLQPRPFAAERQKRRKADSPIRRNWTREEEKLLGTMSDSQLGRQIGCSTNSVWRRRRELAIPAYVPEGRERLGPPLSMLAVNAPRLRQRREAASLTQRDLASLAKVSESHYSLLENGEFLNFRRATADRIARALDCSVEDIASARPPWPACEPALRRRDKPTTNVPLRHGPYHAPAVQIGEFLFCSLRGRNLKVVDWSDSPIPWPRARVGGHLVRIVCGDLEKAMQVESMAAVAFAWGLSLTPVVKWRRGLASPPPRLSAEEEELEASGVPLLRHGPYLAPKVQLGDRLWCESRGKEMRVEAFSSGPIPWPCVLHAGNHSPILFGDLSRAVKSESSQAVQVWWRVSESLVTRWRIALGVGSSGRQLQPESVVLREWTGEEEKLLGSMPDTTLAGQLGCEPYQVWRRRRDMNLPFYVPEGSQPMSLSGSLLSVDSACLKERREMAGMDHRELARLAELSYDHYTLLENGKVATVQRPTAHRVARALDCPVGDIAIEPPKKVKVVVRPAHVPLPRKKPQEPPYVPLRHGPYEAPEVQVEDTLFCSLRGREVTVVHWSDAPLPWPCTQIGSQLSLILCGDLEKALRVESYAAIARVWGISGITVGNWRRAMSIVVEKWRPPATSTTTLAPVEGDRELEPANPKKWTEEEDQQLGTMPDPALARHLGCTFPQVRRRRLLLKIPVYVAEGRRPRGPRQARFRVERESLITRREAVTSNRTEFARLAEVGYEYYLQLEKGGKATFGGATAQRIARALNCAIEDFATEIPAVAPNPPRVPVPRAKPKLPPFVPLQYGPYQAPPVQVGDTLFCSLRGREVTVADWSDAPLPWPRTKIGSRYSLILCGDLVTAQGMESYAAIACAWEVSSTLITQWRHALEKA